MYVMFIVGMVGTNGIAASPPKEDKPKPAEESKPEPKAEESKPAPKEESQPAPPKEEKKEAKESKKEEKKEKKEEKKEYETPKPVAGSRGETRVRTYDGHEHLFLTRASRSR